MQEAQTWRDLLGLIIRDHREKQRLLDELNITPITLSRWVSGESDPRPQNIRQLINALQRQYRDQFRQLLKNEKGSNSAAQASLVERVHTVPAEFYARVLTARATTSEHVRFWSTCRLILQQAIGQLDPERQGMSIWVVRCMPPSGPHQKVRSLRESVGLGTPPWGGNLEQHALFLGAESLTGTVVTQCRPGILQNLEEEHTLIAASRSEHEKSAAIYPILYAGRIAGALLVSSAVPGYFASRTSAELVQYYADLTALAFEPAEFFAPEQIALCVMPAQKEQQAHFSRFRQLITQKMLTNTRDNPVNHVQADMLVWQQLEDELLSIPTVHTL